MAKNKIQDLSDHLFEQLERLNDEDLSPKELEREVKRARAMAGIAESIIDAGALALKARAVQIREGLLNSEMPVLLEHKDEV